MLQSIIFLLLTVAGVISVRTLTINRDKSTDLHFISGHEPIMVSQAPLLNDDLSPDDRVKDSYVVYLNPGHSLDDHARVIQHDLNPHVDHIFSFIKEKVVYVAISVDKDLLAAIRGDTKVEKVEVQGSASPAPM